MFEERKTANCLKSFAMTCYMYTTHFIGFLFNLSFTLTTRINVGTCNTKNEKPKPLTENSADSVKIRTIDKIIQMTKKNEP